MKVKATLAKRVLTVFLAVILTISVGFATTACQDEKEKSHEEKLSEIHRKNIGVDKFKTIDWPETNLANRIPKPKSDYGRIVSESSDSLKVYIGKTTTADFSDYVKNCMDMGFDVDYYKDDDSFHANDAEGYYLSIDMDSKIDDVMCIKLTAPEDETEEPTDAPTEKPTEKATEKPAEDKTEKPEKEEKKNQSNSSNHIRKAMDEYEKMMNEYADFMEKYNNSDDTLSMMDEYTKMLEQYSAAMKEINKIDEDSLSYDDLQYYLEVTTRVTKRLAALGESM